jgi:hypothetical protein
MKNRSYFRELQTFSCQSQRVFPIPEPDSLIYTNNLSPDKPGNGSFQPKGWSESWSYSDDKPEVLVDKVIDKLKRAVDGQTVERISLRKNGIYTGKHTVGDREYATAIYSRKETITKLKKVTVAELKELQTDSISRHLYCESTYIKYLVLAFYEEGETEPALMIQAAKNEPELFSDKHLEAWMRYVGVMTEETEEETTTTEDSDEIVLDESGLWWISQFDEPTFREESCWEISCCNHAANRILENAETLTNRSQQLVIAESNNPDCSGIIGKATEFKEAVRIIDKSLKEHGLPILIGVHHPKKEEKENTAVVAWNDDCSGNIPGITNHYIVIRGKKYDGLKKQWYYLFYEVGTKYLYNGISFENKLYIDNNNNIIEGNTAYKNDYLGNYYKVTEVRKNINQTY